jgi:hypothetical protein
MAGERGEAEEVGLGRMLGEGMEADWARRSVPGFISRPAAPGCGARGRGRGGRARAGEGAAATRPPSTPPPHTRLCAAPSDSRSSRRSRQRGGARRLGGTRRTRAAGTAGRARTRRTRGTWAAGAALWGRARAPERGAESGNAPAPLPHSLFPTAPPTPPPPPPTMFEARLEQGVLLKKVVDAVKDLVTDVNLECSATGFGMQAMDSSHVSLVNFNVRERGGEEGGWGDARGARGAPASRRARWPPAARGRDRWRAWWGGRGAAGALRRAGRPHQGRCARRARRAAGGRAAPLPALPTASRSLVASWTGAGCTGALRRPHTPPPASPAPLEHGAPSRAAPRPQPAPPPPPRDIGRSPPPSRGPARASDSPPPPHPIPPAPLRRV